MASGQKMLTIQSGPHARCDMNQKHMSVCYEVMCLACKHIS
jgi:hypothetical protein